VCSLDLSRNSYSHILLNTLALVMLACLCNASKWRQSPSVVSALDTIISKCTTAAGDPDEAGDRGASELDQQVGL
jgi:hypothetical protein